MTMLTKCVEFTREGKSFLFLLFCPAVNVETGQAAQIGDSEDLQHVDGDDDNGDDSDGSYHDGDRSGDGNGDGSGDDD